MREEKAKTGAMEQECRAGREARDRAGVLEKEVRQGKERMAAMKEELREVRARARRRK